MRLNILCLAADN